MRSLSARTFQHLGLNFIKAQSNQYRLDEDRSKSAIRVIMPRRFSNPARWWEMWSSPVWEKWERPQSRVGELPWVNVGKGYPCHHRLFSVIFGICCSLHNCRGGCGEVGEKALLLSINTFVIATAHVGNAYVTQPPWPTNPERRPRLPISNVPSAEGGSQRRNTSR